MRPLLALPSRRTRTLTPGPDSTVTAGLRGRPAGVTQRLGEPCCQWAAPRPPSGSTSCASTPPGPHLGLKPRPPGRGELRAVLGDRAAPSATCASAAAPDLNLKPRQGSRPRPRRTRTLLAACDPRATRRGERAKPSAPPSPGRASDSESSGGRPGPPSYPGASPPRRRGRPAASRIRVAEPGSGLTGPASARTDRGGGGAGGGLADAGPRLGSAAVPSWWP